MLMTVLMESSASPPRASATRGTKSKPEEWQAERLEESFLWTPTCRAWPGDRAASAIVRSCSGLMTSTSKAVGRPRLQQGMKKSPGRDWEPGTKPGVSLEGAGAVDWAAAWKTSRTALCLAMRSPFPPQPTWWSP